MSAGTLALRHATRRAPLTIGRAGTLAAPDRLSVHASLRRLRSCLEPTRLSPAFDGAEAAALAARDITTK